jgi:hypothetical protein
MQPKRRVKSMEAVTKTPCYRQLARVRHRIVIFPRYPADEPA